MSLIYKLLIDKLNSNSSLIEDWFAEKFISNKPLFCNSVDLRHSGFKIAPVDTNCFPAGFNNLSYSSKEYAKDIVNKFLKENYPNARKILILPESHTRNLKYLNNLNCIYQILSSEGKEVICGSLIENINNKLELEIGDNKTITLHELVRKSNRIVTKSGFVPDLIISNNDFTTKPSDILQNLSQPIIPPLSLGWHNRQKSTYFDIYNYLTKELSNLIDIDHWLISTIHTKCDQFNLKNKKGLDVIAYNVDNILQKIKEKYKEYNINV